MSQILVLCLEVPFLQSLSFNLGYSASDLRAPTASESSEASVIMQIMVHPGQSLIQVSSGTGLFSPLRVVKGSGTLTAVRGYDHQRVLRAELLVPLCDLVFLGRLSSRTC